MKRILFWTAVLCACLVQICGPVRAQERKISITTSIVPQAYFVERIGGDRVEVDVLVKPGSSPATYEPTPRQMAALSQTKLYLRIGVPFENALLPKIEQTVKGLRIVDTRKGIALRKMKAHHHEAHKEEHHQKEHHADQNHHHEDGADPHTWLSPRLVKIQARTIADALIAIDPEGKKTYEKNLAAFLKDLDALQARLAKALAPVRGKTFMVFHPAWGYFADEYGLEQEPIEIEGKEPSPRQLTRIMKTAKSEDVRVIFVQPQFSRASASRVAQFIGGAVVPIDPLARDYIANLDKVAAAVSEALGKQK